MKLLHRLMLIALIVFLCSCSNSRKAASASKTSSSSASVRGNSSSTNAERDGSSMEKAIVVKSVSEEYAYVRKVCPECKFKKQSLLSGKDGKKFYDALYFEKDGSEVVYYFDINKFFGKKL